MRSNQPYHSVSEAWQPKTQLRKEPYTRAVPAQGIQGDHQSWAVAVNSATMTLPVVNWIQIPAGFVHWGGTHKGCAGQFAGVPHSVRLPLQIHVKQSNLVSAVPGPQSRVREHHGFP